MATANITEPLIEPVTLAEAKAHLRIDDTEDDTYIGTLIVAARQRAEIYTELAFISRSVGIYLDSFPCGVFRMTPAPMVSVDAVNYFDAGNTERVLAALEYYSDLKSKPCRLAPVSAWPATYPRPNAVEIEVTAGYGTTAASVPQLIKQAILLMVGDMYENREESVIGVSVSSLPVTAERLLRPFRLLG